MSEDSLPMRGMNMASATIPRLKKISTVADLLKQLGSIPPQRVRLYPTPGTAVEEDVLEVEAREHRHCELIDGVLVEKAMGYEESRLAMLLGHFLLTYLDKRPLGTLAG